MPHDHAHMEPKEGDRRVAIAIWANGLLTVAQIVGGILSGSLALIADAIHNFSDMASLVIAFGARKIARRPAIPRKIFAAVLCGIGAGIAAWRSEPGLIAPLIFGGAAGVLHIGAFGIDPLKDKGMEGIDTFTQDRVAKVVDEAENYLNAMTDAVKRAGDRRVEARVDRFTVKAREMIRTVEEDPRDLIGARKFLGVYLMGARDAAVKFADVYTRTRDQGARTDFLQLLTDLEDSFGQKTRKLLLDSNADLTVEIDVLRGRLQRDGVRLD